MSVHRDAVWSRGLRGAIASAALLVLIGCAGNRAAPAPNASPGVRGSGTQVDVVSASLLRERAFDLLSDLAKAEDPQIRANVLEALAESPARARAAVASGLADPNPGVRSVAAMVAGRGGLAELSPNLRPLVHDESAFVRASAIYALAVLGDGADRTPLAALLLNDPSMRVRSHAAFILGELGEKSALMLLKQAYKAPAPRAARAEHRLFLLQLAEAMLKLGDETQLETVRAALYPSRPEELEATALAVQIIGQVRDRGAIDELIYLTATQDQAGNKMPAEVRLGAAASLARLGLPKGSFIADEYVRSKAPTLRAQSAFVYGETRRPENLPRLEGMMADPSGVVRVAAAVAVVRVTTALGEAERAQGPHGPE